jgi:hypothetical protein
MGKIPIVARSLGTYNKRNLHWRHGDQDNTRKEKGVGMADKRNALLLSLLEQGIHYIEEGDAKLFLVVTKSEEKDTFDFFLRTAKNEDEAKIESVKSGEIVMIHRFADIFAKMLDIREFPASKADLIM